MSDVFPAVNGFDPQLPPSEPPDPCPVCDGQGSTSYTDGECCGSYLGTGECCAAQYGTANLVPVERQEPCEACGGSGAAP